MILGIGLAIASAAIWALSSTLLASQTKRVDTITISALRAFWAVPFFAVALVASGATDKVTEITASDFVQILGQGLVGPTIGDTLYVAAIAMLGMTRAFTLTTALFTLLAYVWSAIFLGESVSWQVGLGSVLVIAGVYLVAVYGRPSKTQTHEPSGAGRRWGLSMLRRPPSAGGSSQRSDPPESGATPEPGLHSVHAVRLPLYGSLPASFRMGLMLALVVGVMWSASSVWLRDISADYDASAVGMVRVPMIAAILLLAAWIVRDSGVRRWSVSLRSHIALALSGIFGTGLTTLFFIIALQRIGAGQTAVLFETSPLFALPMGYLFLHEQITIWVAVGTGIAVVGIVLLA